MPLKSLEAYQGDEVTDMVESIYDGTATVFCVFRNGTLCFYVLFYFLLWHVVELFVILALKDSFLQSQVVMHFAALR